MAHKIISRANARTRGLQKYFTGKPCRRGHIDHRNVTKSYCLSCERERSARRLVENKDPHKQCCARWRNRNREKDQAYVRNKANIDKEAQKRARSRWHEKWYAANWELNKTKTREWRAQNPKKTAAHYRNRVARKKNAEGVHSSSDIDAIFKMQKGRCAYCRIGLDDAFHVDHITPLSKGGSNYRQNLQVLCMTCNLRKRAKLPLEFARTLGMLL